MFLRSHHESWSYIFSVSIISQSVISELVFTIVSFISQANYSALIFESAYSLPSVWCCISVLGWMIGCVCGRGSAATCCTRSTWTPRVAPPWPCSTTTSSSPADRYGGSICAFQCKVTVRVSN